MVTSEVLGEEERIERRRGKEKKKIASPSIESDEETIGGCGKGRESTKKWEKWNVLMGKGV